MKILFPCHPLKRRAVDPDFEAEAEAADEAGFGLVLYNLDVLRNNDVDGALTGLEVSAPSHEVIVHRGWMMSDSLYEQLHKGLRARDYAPVTSPEQYAEAHYFPNAYKHIADFTPESRWMLGRDSDEAWGTYSYFSDGPAIVKDFVKSAKHRWAEACFIPPHTPREKLEAILKALLEDRGNQFNKGILFRRFHPLVQLETDLRGQPVYEEYRLFFFYGELVAATPALHGQGPFDEISQWTAVAKRFQNPFISMDIARQQDGSWIIIEVGDGGVSGLPLSIDSKLFYKALWQRIQEGAAS